jgi:hypothetical protein
MSAETILPPETTAAQLLGIAVQRAASRTPMQPPWPIA